MAKKRRKNKGTLKSVEKLQEQMRKDDLLKNRQIVFTDTENPKLSTVLLEFIEPFNKDAPTREAYEKLITMAIIAWNAAILSGKERKSLVDVCINAIVESTGEEWRRDAEDTMFILIKHKEHYFPDDQRFIVDYRLDETDKEYHLVVASFVKKKRT